MFIKFFIFWIPLLIASAGVFGTATTAQKELQQQMQLQQKMMQQQNPAFQSIIQPQVQPQHGETRSRYWERQRHYPRTYINNYYYVVPQGYYYPQGYYQQQYDYYPGSYRSISQPDYYDRDKRP